MQTVNLSTKNICIKLTKYSMIKTFEAFAVHICSTFQKITHNFLMAFVACNHKTCVPMSICYFQICSFLHQVLHHHNIQDRYETSFSPTSHIHREQINV
jgi:hypothetical protein